MTTPRAYTVEEVRAQFLDHIHGMVDYWATVQPALSGPASATPRTCRERLDGLAFSILVLLDGGAAMLPGFAVIACPHPEDRSFHTERGENYHEPFDREHPQDLGGTLHEQWYRKDAVPS